MAVNVSRDLIRRKLNIKSKEIKGRTQIKIRKIESKSKEGGNNPSENKELFGHKELKVQEVD